MTSPIAFARHTIFTHYANSLGTDRMQPRSGLGGLIINLIAAETIVYSIYFSQLALASLGTLAPSIAAIGTCGPLWTAPYALALLFSAECLMKGPKAALYYAGIPQAGDIVEQHTRSLMGQRAVRLVLYGCEKALPNLCLLALATASLVTIYFGGSYLVGGALLTYTFVEAIDKNSSFQILSPHLLGRVRRTLAGLALVSYLATTLTITTLALSLLGCGLVLFSFRDKGAKYRVEELNEKIAENLCSLDKLEVDQNHMRPTRVPDALDGIPLDQMNFKALVDEVYQSTPLRDAILVKRLHIGDPMRARGHLQEGIAKFCERINTVGEIEQGRAKMAAYAASKQDELDRHSFLINLGIDGHACPTGLKAAIDSLLLHPEDLSLLSQIEALLRNKRKTLFHKHFIAPAQEDIAELIQILEPKYAESITHFLGTNEGVPHVYYAFIYLYGREYGLPEHWGAVHEIEGQGLVGYAIKLMFELYLHILKTFFDEQMPGKDHITDEAFAQAAHDKFHSEYTAEQIVDSIHADITSHDEGTLALGDVLEWLAEWAVRSKKVSLTDEDQTLRNSICNSPEFKNLAQKIAQTPPSDNELTLPTCTILPDVMQVQGTLEERTWAQRLISKILEITVEKLRSTNSTLPEALAALDESFDLSLLRLKAMDYIQNELCTDGAYPTKEAVATMLVEIGILKVIDSKTSPT